MPSNIGEEEEGKADFKREGSIYEDPFADPGSPEKERKKELIASVLEVEQDELTSLKEEEGAKTEVLDNESASPGSQESSLMKSMTMDETKIGETTIVKGDLTGSRLSTQPNTVKKTEKNTQIKETLNQMKFVGKVWGNAGLEILKNIGKKSKPPSSGNINVQNLQPANQATPQNPQEEEVKPLDKFMQEKADKLVQEEQTETNKGGSFIENRDRSNALEKPLVAEKKDMSKFLNSEVYGFSGMMYQYY